MMFSSEKRSHLYLGFAVLLTVLTWFYGRDYRAQWLNVPPAPTQNAALGAGLGDSQFAYRVLGMMIQNLGVTGGRNVALQNYDYEELAEWFYLQHALDPKSNFIPLLAAYYFSGSQDPKKLRPLIEYLRVAGSDPKGEKWRWLAQATYLARYKLQDYDLGLQLARELASLPNEDMPLWARQMPAYVLNQQGQKQAALDIMIELLKTNADKMHPNEVNATIDHICTQILDEEEAALHPLCQEIQ
jgi:hypothetical protein